MDPKQNKPAKLRERNVEELTQSVAALRKELSGLRVSKVSSGVASKLAKIKVSTFLLFLFPRY
jgi:ribosomal protein L29